MNGTTKTFDRLPDRKKQHFLSAAYKEFALHDFEVASITHLVKELGIAKGSVYQYFNNKLDLYEYLLTHAYETLDELTSRACPFHSGDDFYEWFTNFLIVQTKFQLSFPHYALLFQHLENLTEPQVKQIHEHLQAKWERRLAANLPIVLFKTDQLSYLLGSSPRMLFRYLVHKHNILLNQIILLGESIEIDSEELVEECSSWVNMVKNGTQL